LRLSTFIIINELASIYGKGITFVDIDETIFHTFAKIFVRDTSTGEIIRKLSNQEFNTYELKPSEEYDFGEFRDAKFFQKTSIPIPKTVNRLKRMLKNIDRRDSDIVFLTARGRFDSKKDFLDTFQKYGIPMDRIVVEFSSGGGSIAEYKKSTVMKYLRTGKYRRVRLIDDDMSNLRAFLKIENSLPDEIIEKVKNRYNITTEESIPVIEFFALHIDQNGNLRRVK